MEKHQSILDLLKRLESTIVDFSHLKIVDFWDGDLCAIGLQKGNKLVYISTYLYLHLAKCRFDFDFEILNKEVDKLDVIREARNVSEVELIKEIATFFELSSGL